MGFGRLVVTITVGILVGCSLANTALSRAQESDDGNSPAGIVSTRIAQDAQPPQAREPQDSQVRESGTQEAAEDEGGEELDLITFQPELDRQPPEDETDPRVLFNQGFYQQAAELARQQDDLNQRYNADERFLLLAIRSQMLLGNYSQALTLHQEALEKFPQSVRHRWLGVQVQRMNNDPQAAQTLLIEIEDLVRRAPWRYRDLDNQLALVDFLLSQGVDAKEILNQVLNPIKQRNTRLPEVYLVIGRLALEKADYALAATNFEEACRLDKTNPAAFYGLACAYKPSDWRKAAEALQQALSLNPQHPDSLLLLIDQQISGEAYTTANDLLDEVLKQNAQHPIAWAYKSVLAHLNADSAAEVEHYQKALEPWSSNPEVDFVVGRELSEKYRFQEGSQHQRQALKFDPAYLPAKMQLAHDLLRLGQELEGWKLAEEVFDADQYSVVAHNLLTLRDNISDFQTLERNGFVVRMEQKEAGLYGDYVLELLTEAESVLIKKYDVTLQKPVFIEVFPRQQDFAIRTFGLPGGDGYLGVCFGRLITMNSPAAQGSSLTNWRSVLWHEFCHVVTLQKTRNKMPRWLSEGISVYEENLRDPAWGQNINPTFQTFLRGEELTPVSKLSAAFLSPKSALHVQFAYYESSLVVRYLIDKFGQEALQNVLNELAEGMNINDALSRHAAPIDFIDKDFEKYAHELADQFAPDANFEMPKDDVPQSLEQWTEFNKENPNHIPGLMFQARGLTASKEFQQALPILEKVIELAPDVANDARQMLATCYRNLDETEEEWTTLEDLSQRDGDSVEVLSRLLEMAAERNDWQKTKFYGDRLVGLNPLIRQPHSYLAQAAEQTNDTALNARALAALVQLDPVDPADVHLRLAQALHRLGSDQQAKRHVLFALEQAPRYREAHKLLLSLVPPPPPTFDPPPRPKRMSSANANGTNRTGEQP